MTGPIAVQYPAIFEWIAAQLAELRLAHSDDLDHLSEEYRRGKQSLDVYRLGYLGELIVRHWLVEKNYPFESSPLFATKNYIAPDLIVGGKGVDVKTVPQYARELQVNEKAHKKSKGVSQYAFVKPTGMQTANLWWVTHDEVSAWELVTSTYTPLYRYVIPQTS